MDISEILEKVRQKTVPTPSQSLFPLGLAKRIIPEAGKNLYHGDGFISK